LSELSTAAVTAATPIAKYPAHYIGSDGLAGIEPNSDGAVTGEYWEQEAEGGSFFLFQPSGSSKVFEVSDVDIRRTPALSLVSSN